jgi:hypothetical protein
MVHDMSNTTQERPKTGSLMSTMTLARSLGVSYWRLIGLLRSGQLCPPQKGSDGSYQWTPTDIKNVERLLRARRDDS